MFVNDCIHSSPQLYTVMSGSFYRFVDIVQLEITNFYKFKNQGSSKMPSPERHFRSKLCVEGLPLTFLVREFILVNLENVLSLK